MPSKRFTDLSAKAFGRLHVIDRAPNKNGRTMWNCICSCGTSKTVRSEHLTNGATESCGCIKQEQRKSHGMSRTATYKCWQAIKDRCTNTRNAQYKDYGARGITVCDSWLAGFDAFFADMGEPPRGHTIERIDNYAGYSKRNCRWASRHDQSRNKRVNIIINIDGDRRTLKDWSLHFGTPYSTARHRYIKGLPASEIFKR